MRRASAALPWIDEAPYRRPPKTNARAVTAINMPMKAIVIRYEVIAC
jgi:hypothetical protein